MGGPGSDVVHQRGAGLGWHPVAGLGAERRRWRRVATAAASWISAVVSRWLRVSGGIAGGGAGVSRRARSSEGGAGKRDISWGSHGRNMLSVEIIWPTRSRCHLWLLLHSCGTLTRVLRLPCNYELGFSFSQLSDHFHPSENFQSVLPWGFTMQLKKFWIPVSFFLCCQKVWSFSHNCN